MISKENVEKYFQLLQSKGIIADYWNFDGFYEEDEYLKIHYLHKSGKRASYRFPKERVIQDIRENILRELFD